MASNNSNGISKQLSTCVLSALSQLGLGSASDSESLSQDHGNGRNLRRRRLVGPGLVASPTRQPRKAPVCHHPHGAGDTATSTPNQYGVNRPCIRQRSESASSMSVPITPDPPGWTGTSAKVLDGSSSGLLAELVDEDCPAPESTPSLRPAIDRLLPPGLRIWWRRDPLGDDRLELWQP